MLSFVQLQSEGHRQILTKELEAVGLRLNKRPPQVSANAELHFLLATLCSLCFLHIPKLQVVYASSYKIAYFMIVKLRLFI